MSNWVIGDVHGCAVELELLIEKIHKQDQNAQLICVGDLFDRAPYGDRVWQLLNEHNILAIRGNHEQKLLNYLTGKRPDVPRHYYHALELLYQVTTVSKLVNYLDSLPLQITIDNPAPHIIVHAGVNIHDPYDEDVGANVYGHWKPRPWFDLYEGEPFVIYGHICSGSQSPIIRKNSIGIDTAACRGGWLTGYCLETKQIEQAKSQTDYFAELKQTLANAARKSR